AILLVIGTGLVHGYWTDRWSRDELGTSAGESLQALPMFLAEWEGQEIDTKFQLTPGLNGQLLRRYINRQTGEGVTLAIICGRPGPVSIHTPEVCYGGSGFTIKERKTIKAPYGDNNPDFFTAKAIRSRVTEQTTLRLFWAWNAGGDWRVSESPRL